MTEPTVGKFVEEVRRHGELSYSGYLFRYRATIEVDPGTGAWKTVEE